MITAVIFSYSLVAIFSFYNLMQNTVHMTFTNSSSFLDILCNETFSLCIFYLSVKVTRGMIQWKPREGPLSCYRKIGDHCQTKDILLPSKHSVNEYVFSTYCLPDMSLGIGNSMVNRTKILPSGISPASEKGTYTLPG